MNGILKDVRIPGVVWAVLLTLVIAIIHENQGVWGIDAFYVDLVVVGLIALLKSLNLGDGQLQQALDVIDSIRRREGAGRMRGSVEGPSGGELRVPHELPLTDKVPPRPNKFVRWLVG